MSELCWGVINLPQSGGSITPKLNKRLRVVPLGDGETAHNAFPDRDSKESTK